MKKIILSLLILSLAIACSPPVDKVELETCMAEFDDSDAVDGQLIVRFVEGVGKAEARSVIESYDLTWKENKIHPGLDSWKFWVDLGVIIEVPSGKEVKWACTLIQNEKIDSAVRNNILMPV